MGTDYIVDKAVSTAVFLHGMVARGTNKSKPATDDA